MRDLLLGTLHSDTEEKTNYVGLLYVTWKVKFETCQICNHYFFKDCEIFESDLQQGQFRYLDSFNDF